MANTQLQWGVVDAYTEQLRDHYGHERWSNMYKFRTFVEAGGTVSIHPMPAGAAFGSQVTQPSRTLPREWMGRGRRRRRIAAKKARSIHPANRASWVSMRPMIEAGSRRPLGLHADAVAKYDPPASPPGRARIDSCAFPSRPSLVWSPPSRSTSSSGRSKTTG